MFKLVIEPFNQDQREQVEDVIRNISLLSETTIIAEKEKLIIGIIFNHIILAFPLFGFNFDSDSEEDKIEFKNESLIHLREYGIERVIIEMQEIKKSLQELLKK